MVFRRAYFFGKPLSFLSWRARASSSPSSPSIESSAARLPSFARFVILPNPLLTSSASRRASLFSSISANKESIRSFLISLSSGTWRNSLVLRAPSSSSSAAKTSFMRKLFGLNPEPSWSVFFSFLALVLERFFLGFLVGGFSDGGGAASGPAGSGSDASDPVAGAGTGVGVGTGVGAGAGWVVSGASVSGAAVTGTGASEHSMADKISSNDFIGQLTTFSLAGCEEIFTTRVKFWRYFSV